jgi:LacI family transcriptional regulator
MSKSGSVTIQDVARACGVSPTTVSLVLNNSNRRISTATRERVLRYVRETRYQPSALARGTKVKRLSTLGVLSGHGGGHYLHYSYYLQILGGVMEFAQANRLNLLILNEQLWSGTLSELRFHIDGRCGGIILIGVREVNELVPALLERGIPFVVVSRTAPNHEVSCVDVDNRDGAHTVVRYLIQQGHRRIGMIRGSLGGVFDTERFDGYCDALREANLSFNPELVFDALDSGYNETGGEEMAAKVLSLPQPLRPTAIFCASDQMSYGAINVFQQNGVHIPSDISIAGFDDEYKAAYTTPPLTTLRQPYDQIGSRAAEILVKIIQGGEQGCLEFLPGELVIRGSVSPPEKC